MTSPLTSALSTAAARADAGQARIEQKERNQVDAMKTLMKAQADSAEKRKSAARQKLERLKQQIAQLRLMGASPQQIAALARELSAAVKAYGGGAGEMIGVSTGAPASAPASNPGDPAQADQPQTDLPQADLAAQALAAQDETPDDPDAQKPETPYDKTLRALQDDAARMARHSAQSQQDREFVSLARRLASELKAAAEAAARKDARDARDAQNAAQGADQAVTDAEQALQPGGGPAGLFLSV